MSQDAVAKTLEDVAVEAIERAAQNQIEAINELTEAQLAHLKDREAWVVERAALETRVQELSAAVDELGADVQRERAKKQQSCHNGDGPAAWCQACLEREVAAARGELDGVEALEERASKAERERDAVDRLRAVLETQLKERTASLDALGQRIERSDQAHRESCTNADGPAAWCGACLEREVAARTLALRGLLVELVEWEAAVDTGGTFLERIQGLGAILTRAKEATR